MADQLNKRKIIIQDKEYESLESVANAFGKSRNTVDYRLSKGWTPEQAVGIQLFRLREEGLPLLSERDISFKWSDNTFPIISSLINQIIKFADFAGAEREKLQNYVDGDSLLNNKLYREIVSHLPAPPYELSFAAKKPELVKEWAYDLNVPLSPEHFRPAANKNVWWRCGQAILGKLR